MVPSGGSNTDTGGELRSARQSDSEGSVHWPAVDPFALVLLGGAVALAVVVWLLGRYHPGSGSEQLGLRSSREISEMREALEAEDLEQMLSAHNARRKARGEPVMTLDELVRRANRNYGEG